MKSTFGTRPESSMAAWRRSLAGFRIRSTLTLLALIPWHSVGCRKQEAAKAPAQAQPVKASSAQLPPDIAREVVGRWRIFSWDTCGMVNMINEEIDQYIGKIAVIEPGRAVWKDHLNDEHTCRFRNVKVSVRDTTEHLAGRTRCSAEDPLLVDFVGKVKAKKVKVFETEFEPYYCVSPFSEFFMPDSNTLVADWEGIYFFMNRIGDAGETGRTEPGAASGSVTAAQDQP